MISQKPTNERRADARLENNIPVKIIQEDGDLVSETLNISRSGTYCRVEKYIAPMTKLKIHLLICTVKEGKKDAKKVSCDGVVVRSEPVKGEEGYHLAIFFSDVSKRDTEIITDYVGTHLQKDEVL